MKSFITTTFVRAGGWLAGARGVRAAMTPLRSTRRWNRLLFFVACLLMCFNSITAWAGIEPWTPSEYRFGACGPNDNRSLPFYGFNNAGFGSAGWFNYYNGYGTGVSGNSVNWPSKMGIWSVYYHTVNVPAYTRIRLNWNFTLEGFSNYFNQTEALYARDDFEALKNTPVDFTEGYSDGTGSNYNLAHLSQGGGNTGLYDLNKSFDYDNRNSSSQQNKTWALLLTQVIGNGYGSVIDLNNWAMFKTKGYNWEYYYYKHITFDANGGSGSMSQQTIENSGTLKACSLTRNGYVFAGWNTKADGSGTYYADKASINATSSDKGSVKLYAQWLSTAAFRA